MPKPNQQATLQDDALCSLPTPETLRKKLATNLRERRLLRQLLRVSERVSRELREGRESQTQLSAAGHSSPATAKGRDW